MKKIIFSALALLLCLCAACGEERLSGEGVYDSSDKLLSFSEYKYDGRGNVLSCTTYEKAGYMEYGYKCEYDGNVLTKEEHFNSDESTGYTFLFEYDEEGKLVKKHYLDENGEEGWVYVYEYEDGKKVKYTVYENGEAGLYAEYEYDEDGNQTKETVYNADGSLKRYDVFLYENGKNVTTYRYQTGDKPEKTLISEYDEQGRIIKQTTCSEWGPQVITYTVYKYK